MEVRRDDCPCKRTFQNFEAECLLGFVLSSCCRTCCSDLRNSNWRNLEGFHQLHVANFVLQQLNQYHEIPSTPF
ncbi:hypothetical protein V6Z11_D11G346300 [Gossypium hirsutum]